jgi:hypothetical protein
MNDITCGTMTADEALPGCTPEQPNSDGLEEVTVYRTAGKYTHYFRGKLVTDDPDIIFDCTRPPFIYVMNLKTEEETPVRFRYIYND